MAQGDARAVDVGAGGVEPQLPYHVNGLGGEGLVQLDQVDVVQGDARALQHLARRWHGAGAHVGRLDARHGPAHPTHARRDALRGRALGRHDDERGSGVVHPRGVAGGHRATVLEGGPERCELLDAGICARVLISAHDHRVPAALRRADRHDLAIEAPLALGRYGPRVALGRQRILVLAAHLVALRHVLGGHAHVVVVDGAAQPHGEGIDQLAIAVAQAIEAHAGRQVGHGAHALHAARDDDVGVTRHDGVGRHVDGFEAR